MNNWNVVIHDTEEDELYHSPRAPGRNDGPDATPSGTAAPYVVAESLLQNYGSVTHDSTTPPAKPARPPPEAIHRTSASLLQFLSINDSADTAILSHEPSMENLRASMRGPRELPMDIEQPRTHPAVAPPVPPPRKRSLQPIPAVPAPADAWQSAAQLQAQAQQQLPPPYPVDMGISDGEDADDDDDIHLEHLPVLPPVEMQQYGAHQRVASSIMDSTGVSIQEFDFFDLKDDERSTVPTLTPTRSGTRLNRHQQLQQQHVPVDLPALKPMASPMPSPTKSLDDKPLPQIPPVQPYEGEYTQKDAAAVPAPAVQLKLPDLPFRATSLTNKHFQACKRTSLVSHVWSWCIALTSTWFPGARITLAELERSLFLLFKFHSPQLSDILLEAIASDVTRGLCASGHVRLPAQTDGEGTADSEGTVALDTTTTASGVLPTLRDCYSPMNHIFPTPYRCYSHCCTYERLNYAVAPAALAIQTSNMVLGDDWVSHWHLSRDQLDDISKRVQIQQSHIFDAIKSVRTFINAGKVLLEVFGEGFMKNKQYFGNENNLDWDKFYDDAFKTVRDLNNVTREYLFEPLIQKLNDDGKYIVGVSEIFHHWLVEVQVPLLIYAEKRVPVYNLIKAEAGLKYSKFTEWITRTNASVSRDCTSERLFSVQFLTFFTTLKVTLLAILKKTDQADPEHRSLTKVLDKLDLLMQRSDKTQADAEKKIDIQNLKRKLVFKSKEQSKEQSADADLDLDNTEREVYKIGSVVRKRDILHRVLNDQDVVLILLDNYLLICEQDSSSGAYTVNEAPIHICYAFIESKRSDEQSVSIASTPLVAKSPTKSKQQEIKGYVFRLYHPAKGMNYTFETQELEDKLEWLQMVNKAKAAFNAKSTKFEPFKLSVIGDSLLGIDQTDVSGYRQIVPANDGAMAAVRAADSDLPRIESMSKMLSLNRFRYHNKKFMLMGTTSGLFMTRVGKPRDWKSVLDLKNITQVEVLEEFGLLFILSDKNLSYYFLDSFMNSDRVVGEKLSKQDVAFFKIGKQNGVTMVFYMKQKQSASYFKVLIPISEKSTGKVESFQEYKKFYIPGECQDLTIFNSTFVIHTKKNFEVMSLSIAYPQSIPDLNTESLSAPLMNNLKKMMAQPHLRALGIFKLSNNQEFLVCYNKFAIFVNKSGTVSRERLIKFTIKATKAYFDKNLLILANGTFVEVWYINDTKDVSYQLVQVVSGQDLTLICDNRNRGVISMVHPEFPERQLILQLQPKF